jgi:hypothetical protein
VGKGIQIGNTELNLSTDGMLPFTELISEFSKDVGYKINRLKSVVFLYTNNEQSENDIKKIIYNSIRMNYMLQW